MPSRPRDLVWRANRATADVVARGAPAPAKSGHGKVVKRRPATAEEDRLMDRGEYIRTRADGRSPDDTQTKRSRIRPRLAVIQRERVRKQQQRRERATDARGTPPDERRKARLRMLARRRRRKEANG